MMALQGDGSRQTGPGNQATARRSKTLALSMCRVCFYSWYEAPNEVRKVIVERTGKRRREAVAV